MNKLDDFPPLDVQTIESWTKVDETNVHQFCAQPVTYGEYLLASYDGVFGAANPDINPFQFDVTYGFNKRRPLSIIIPYIYNADTNTSDKHIYLKLYAPKQNVYGNLTYNSCDYGTSFIFPNTNTNFISFVNIQNTLGAEFSNIVDNYKPSAYRTQYWITLTRD
jgi:hypothetical protein